MLKLRVGVEKILNCQLGICGTVRHSEIGCVQDRIADMVQLCEYSLGFQYSVSVFCIDT